MKRNAGSDRRTPWEHLQLTGDTFPASWASSGDWDSVMIRISPQRHVTRGLCFAPAPPRADMCSLWLEHYGLPITPGLWTLNLKTDTRDRDLLNTAGVLGKKENYVLICCSICISTFAVNFCVEFDKWVSPSNRELCVLCKIRLMGDWKKEIGSRLENKELLRFRQNPTHWDLRLWSPVVIFQFVFSTLCSTIRFIVLDWNVYKISF